MYNSIGFKHQWTAAPTNGQYSEESDVDHRLCWQRGMHQPVKVFRLALDRQTGTHAEKVGKLACSRGHTFDIRRVKKRSCLLKRYGWPHTHDVLSGIVQLCSLFIFGKNTPFLVNTCDDHLVDKVTKFQGDGMVYGNWGSYERVHESMGDFSPTTYGEGFNPIWLTTVTIA